MVTQPGARVDQRTYCPVSGVVFKVTAASPKREAGGQPFYFCCEACAAYFAANQDRVLALRGLAPARR